MPVVLTAVPNGRLIRERRIRKGFPTQEAFGNKIGKGQSWISAIENGREASFATLCVVAEELGMDVDEIILAEVA